MSTNSSDPKCAACDKAPPRPTLICDDCSEGVDLNGAKESTPYCTTLCRQLDVRDHRKHCDRANRRKQVYRAGKLLQASFYVYRNVAFDLKISLVQKRGDIVLMYDDEYQEQDFFIYSPPSAESLEDDDRNAILSYGACTDACMHFHKLSKKLLGGIYDLLLIQSHKLIYSAGISSKMEEVDLRIEPSMYKVKRVTISGAPFPGIPRHQILAVETIDGDSFVLDIAGAQLGQHHPVLPLETFMDTYRKPVIDMIYEHGHGKSKIVQKLQSLLNTPGMDGRAPVLQAHMVEAFNDSVAAWEKRHRTTVSEMTGSTRSRCVELMKDFIDVAYDAILDGMDVLKQEVTKRVDMRKLVKKLEQTDPLPEMSMITLNNKNEGSPMHQIWVAQQKDRVKHAEPMMWRNVYEPQLAKGGNVYVPIGEVESGWDNKYLPGTA